MTVSVKQFNLALDGWPTAPNSLFETNGSGCWIKARPNTSIKSSPQISLLGSNENRTQPDGLYAFFHEAEFVDLIVLEACKSLQNLHDKRSRYMPTHQGIQLSVPRSFLVKKITPQGKKTEVSVSEYLKLQEKDYEMPIRFLRVLFFLNRKNFQSIARSHIGLPYEYFTSYKPLYTSQGMQRLLKAMSPSWQYLGKQ